jgi:membrane dipeptidase
MNSPKLSLLALALVPLTGLQNSSMTVQNPSTRQQPEAPGSVSAKARAIHDSAIVVDTHADTTQRLLDENFDLAGNTPISVGHWDLGKARAGNLGAEFFSIWVEPKYAAHYAQRANDLIDSVYEQAVRHPDQMLMAFSVADIRRARTGEPKRVAALLGIEGGHAIENDIRLLRNFYRLGVRYMTLTWSNTNEWADSSGDIDDPKVPHHNGLTGFGKEVVREMNRLGMMVDISHVSDKTFWDTIEVSQAPVIASHSSARALTNHPRNMTDDMLRAVAKNGGVVMVNFFSAFVDEDFRKQYAAMARQRDEALKQVAEKYKDAGAATRYAEQEKAARQWTDKVPRPALKSLIDHIDHIAKVAGIDHVGLGSDFDGVSGATPQGIDSVADLPKITQALLDRGYTAEQIKKVLGENLLRVFAQVENKARELQGKDREPSSPAETSDGRMLFVGPTEECVKQYVATAQPKKH